MRIRILRHVCHLSAVYQKLLSSLYIKAVAPVFPTPPAIQSFILCSFLLSDTAVEYQQRRGGNQHAQHGHGHAERYASLLEFPVDVGGDHQHIGRRDQAGCDQLTESNDERSSSSPPEIPGDHGQSHPAEHIAGRFRRKSGRPASRLSLIWVKAEVTYWTV